MLVPANDGFFHDLEGEEGVSKAGFFPYCFIAAGHAYLVPEVKEATVRSPKAVPIPDVVAPSPVGQAFSLGVVF